jgi:hypothetical protein
MWNKQASRTSLRDAFKAVHCLSRLVGLAPYCFITDTKKNAETIEISWRKNVNIVSWSLIMLAVQFVGLLYVIVLNFIQTPHSLSGFVAKTLQFPLINATGLVALALSLSINRKKMMDIVEKLSIVDKCIFQNEERVTQKHNIKFMIIIMINVTYHIVLHGINMYINPSGHLNYYYGVSIYLCDFTWAVNDLQYVNIVEILTQRLTSLNREIDRIFVSQSCCNFTSKTSRHYIREEEFCFSDLREGLHNKDRRVLLNTRRLTGFRSSTSGITSGVAARILDLRICYKNLYHVCRLINSMYGLTLLMGFMAYTVCIILDVYTTCCLLITQYKGHQLVSVPRVVTAVLWTVSSCTKVFSGVSASHMANSQFKETVIKIRKLTLPSGLKPGIHDQLELFSIQLSNNKIDFTACGFFSVNFKLVRSLVYTVITHIIVLIQVTWFN